MASRAKLKASNQEKRLRKWKEHSKKLLGNPPKTTDEHIQKVINDQLDVKLGDFMQRELDAALKKKKIKSRKAAGLEEILPEVYLMSYFLKLNREIDERLHSSLSQERWPRNH